jgi:hypothetical protein
VPWRKWHGTRLKLGPRICHPGHVADPHLPRSIGDLPVPVRNAAAALRSELAEALGGGLHALYLYGAVTFPESEGVGDLDYHAIMSGAVPGREWAAYQAPAIAWQACPAAATLMAG